MTSVSYNPHADDFDFPAVLSNDSLICKFKTIITDKKIKTKSGKINQMSWTAYVGLSDLDGKEIQSMLNESSLISKKGQFTNSELDLLFDFCHKITQRHQLKHQNLTHNRAFFIIDSHQVNSKHRFGVATIIENGKNLGRKNATNPYFQAMMQAYSKYNKKLETKDKVKPMLAKGDAILVDQYEKEEVEKLYVRNSYCQPKLDGIRCCVELDNPVVPYSRDLKDIVLSKTMMEDLATIHESLGFYNYKAILDGELYQDNMDLSEISGIVRNVKDKGKKELLQYHIFDIFFVDENKVISNLPYSSRLEFLDRIKDFNLKSIVIVETVKVESPEFLYNYYKRKIAENYEGVILRPNLPYINKNRDNLVKIKPVFREEFQLIDFTEGAGKDKGLVVFKCQLTETTIAKATEYLNEKNRNISSSLITATFGVRPKKDETWRRKEFTKLRKIQSNGFTYFENHLKNEKYTVEFQDWSKDLKPLRPVGIDYRNIN